MDGLSAAASVDALAGLAIKLYIYGDDVIHADREKEQYRKIMKGLEEELKSLARLQRASEGHPEALYYENLFRVGQKGSPGVGRQQGALISMSEAMERMHQDLRDRRGWKKRMMKFKWTIDKGKFQAMLKEIQEWRNQVQFAMQEDQLTIAVDSLTIGRDTSDRVQKIQRGAAETQAVTYDIALLSKINDERTRKIEVHGDNANDGIKSIKADTHALRIRKERKDRVRLYEIIANWLSRLDFNARHSEIYDRCIDISQGLIDSPEFQAWRSQRPWILFCWADAGAGKVSMSVRDGGSII